MPLDPAIDEMMQAIRGLGLKTFSEQTPPEARDQLARMRAMTPPLPARTTGSIVDVTFRGADGTIKARRYGVAGGSPIGRIVYFHGGGWVIGDLDSADGLCCALSDASGCEVISVDYRLAPEHPFPAGLHDGWVVLQALAAQDNAPLMVAGDSAGGNLAAALCLRARDEHGPALAAQILFYPVIDHDFERTSYVENGSQGWVVSTADMKWFWNHYIADPSARRHPFASPLHASSHAALPPALIIVADLDPLRDEGIAYADSLSRAGTSVSLLRYDAMPHGFVSFAGVTDRAEHAIAQAADWARKHVAAPAEIGI